MSALRSSPRLPREVNILCRARLLSHAHVQVQGPVSFSSSRRSVRSSSSASSSPASPSSRRLSFPNLPCFQAKGKDIQVLYDPKQFYSFLLDKIRNAKKRIFLASLYVGKEETELIQALHDSLKANPFLEVHIITDFLRSTREHPASTSSASLLASLQATFPSQVTFSLYHTPALHGLLSKIVPKRYNEGWGLWHGKIYGFDDDVLLSGANLSTDYFTNRQDRYIAFLNHSSLADYMHEFVKTFCGLSYTVKGRTSAISSSDNLDIVWNKERSAPEPTKDPKAYTSAAKEVLSAFMATWQRKSSLSKSLSTHLSPGESPSSTFTSTSTSSFDTTIQPFLQMGQFDIKQETDMVIPAILKQVQQRNDTRLDWTSGYFSVRKPYKDGLLEANGPVHVVCASPEANGFYQSAGFSKYIPPAYTYLESQFWESVKAHGKTDSLSIDEWKREGWTYHSKGIWLSPLPPLSSASKEAFASKTDGSLQRKQGEEEENLSPYLTFIGSSNYGYRSAVRDVEINAVVQTESKELSEALGAELRNIRQHANDPVDDELFKRKDRYVGPVNKLAARIIADML